MQFEIMFRGEKVKWDDLVKKGLVHNGFEPPFASMDHSKLVQLQELAKQNPEVEFKTTGVISGLPKEKPGIVY